MSDGRRHFGGVVGTNENKKSTSTKKRQMMRRNRSFVQLLQQQNLTHIHHYIHPYKTLLRAIISKYFTKFTTTGKKASIIALLNPYSMIMNAMAWRENYLNY